MPLQEKAYLDIQKMIDSGELKLGTVYSETKLSQLLDISRTPLRSALNRMAQDGYIDILPSRGFVLHEMTSSEFLDYVDVVCAIENFAAFHCLQTKEKQGKCLKKMDQIQARMATAEVGELSLLNNEFHTTLIQMNGNLIMNRNYHTTLHLMRTQHTVKEFNENDREILQTKHAELLDILHTGNAEALFSHINAHIRYELIK